MNAKYHEVCISYGSKVMDKVKVFLPQNDRVADRQTEQKPDAPNSISGV